LLKNIEKDEVGTTDKNGEVDESRSRSLGEASPIGKTNQMKQETRNEQAS
jgi:hypothetical protein